MLSMASSSRALLVSGVASRCADSRLISCWASSAEPGQPSDFLFQRGDTPGGVIGDLFGRR